MLELTKNEVLSIIEEAIAAREYAYVPYSHFKVGAVVIDENNNHYKGCNVENGSFGLTVCGERTAIFTGVANGMKKIKYLCVVADTTVPVAPCGACRQVMQEFSDKDTKIIMANLKKDYKIVTIAELLPFPFIL